MERAAKNRVRKRAGVLSAVIPILAAAIIAVAGLAKEPVMQPESDFWKALEAVWLGRPYTPERVAALLGAELELESENDYTLFYCLKPGATPRRFPHVSAVDLRISKTKPGDPGFLSIDLSGSSISLAEVRARYPSASFEPAMPGPPPQGVSPENANYLIVQQPEGRLSFGFIVKNPNELGRVILAPASP